MSSHHGSDCRQAFLFAGLARQTGAGPGVGSISLKEGIAGVVGKDKDLEGRSVADHFLTGEQTFAFGDIWADQRQIGEERSVSL